MIILEHFWTNGFILKWIFFFRFSITKKKKISPELNPDSHIYSQKTFLNVFGKVLYCLVTFQIITCTCNLKNNFWKKKTVPVSGSDPVLDPVLNPVVNSVYKTMYLFLSFFHGRWVLKLWNLSGIFLYSEKNKAKVTSLKYIRKL